MARGCEEPVEGEANVLIIDGEEQRRCPRRPILEDPGYYADIFYLYRQSKAGYLSEDGGLSNQPAKLMELFREIETAQYKIEQHKEEQEAAKRRRRAVNSARR